MNDKLLRLLAAIGLVRNDPLADMTAVLASLFGVPQGGRNTNAFTLINQARTPADYLLASILPERDIANYQASSSNMTVRTIMAGLVAMDSPLPPGGFFEASSFSESIFKVGIQVAFNEQQMRELQQTIMQMIVQGLPSTEYITTTFLNAFQKMIIQAHFDLVEWMRGQVLSTGRLVINNGNLSIDVDYGVPAANILPVRTGANAYDGATSKFWDDIILLSRLLRAYGVRAFLVHPDTFDVIINNPANKIVVTAGDIYGGVGPVTVRKQVLDQVQPTGDARDTVTLLRYGNESETYDIANKTTKRLPFLPPGKLIAVANNTNSSYPVGRGSSEQVQNTLGYVHIGPTVEGGGQTGRFGRVLNPQDKPTDIRMEGVANLMPVIEAPQRLAIATTAMPV
jgi:hypothetical protein